MRPVSTATRVVSAGHLAVRKLRAGPNVARCQMGSWRPDDDGSVTPARIILQSTLESLMKSLCWPPREGEEHTAAPLLHKGYAPEWRVNCGGYARVFTTLRGGLAAMLGRARRGAYGTMRRGPAPALQRARYPTPVLEISGVG
jgi:hypothetical protein